MKKTSFSNLLSHFRFERQQAIKAAEADLWKSNGLENPKHRAGHKLETVKSVGINGQETITIYLTKTVDKRILSVSSQIKVDIEREDNDQGKTAEGDSGSPI